MKGQEIKKRIKELGLTSNHVAEQVGISKTTLSFIINDKQPYISNKLSKTIENYLASCKTMNDNKAIKLAGSVETM